MNQKTPFSFKVEVIIAKSAAAVVNNTEASKTKET
jgi:hypothetical protein